MDFHKLQGPLPGTGMSGFALGPVHVSHGTRHIVKMTDYWYEVHFVLQNDVRRLHGGPPQVSGLFAEDRDASRCPGTCPRCLWDSSDCENNGF